MCIYKLNLVERFLHFDNNYKQSFQIRRRGRNNIEKVTLELKTKAVNDPLYLYISIDSEETVYNLDMNNGGDIQKGMFWNLSKG